MELKGILKKIYHCFKFIIFIPCYLFLFFTNSSNMESHSEKSNTINNNVSKNPFPQKVDVKWEYDLESIKTDTNIDQNKEATKNEDERKTLISKQESNNHESNEVYLFRIQIQLRFLSKKLKI